MSNKNRLAKTDQKQSPTICYETNRDIFINILSFLNLKHLFKCSLISKNFLPFLWEKDGVIDRTFDQRKRELSKFKQGKNYPKVTLNYLFLWSKNLKLLDAEIMGAFISNLSNRTTRDITFALKRTPTNFQLNLTKRLVRWVNQILPQCSSQDQKALRDNFSLIAAKFNDKELNNLYLARLNTKEQPILYFSLACKFAELGMLEEAKKHANLSGRLKANTYCKITLILHKKGDTESVKQLIKNTGNFEQKIRERIFGPAPSKLEQTFWRIGYGTY